MVISRPHVLRPRPCLPQTRIAAALAAALAAGAASYPLIVGCPPAHADAGRAVQTLLDVPYRGKSVPTLDVHRRTGARGRGPAVVVVHGGSWRSGSKGRMTAVSEALADHGFVVFNIDYRLSKPGRPGLRRQQADLRAAVRWIRGHARRFHVDPSRVGALGASAGGHLASLLALRGAGNLTEGTRIRAAVTWSSPFDLTLFRPGWLGGALEMLLGCAALDCATARPAASPIAYVSPDDPPMLIANSRHEVIPLAQAEAMAARLQSAGVAGRLRVLDGSRHAVRYARAMLPATVAFLERNLAAR